MVTNVRVGVLRSLCDLSVFTLHTRERSDCDNHHPRRLVSHPTTYSANVALITPHGEGGRTPSSLNDGYRR